RRLETLRLVVGQPVARLARRGGAGEPLGVCVLAHRDTLTPDSAPLSSRNRPTLTTKPGPAARAARACQKGRGDEGGRGPQAWWRVSVRSMWAAMSYFGAAFRNTPPPSQGSKPMRGVAGPRGLPPPLSCGALVSRLAMATAAMKPPRKLMLTRPASER